MNHKKVLLALIMISSIGFFIGLIFTEQEYFSTCREGYTYQYGEVNNINNPPRIGCSDPIADILGQPLGLGSLALLLPCLILLFLKPEVFKSWAKFAVIAIPLLALFIVGTPVQCGGGSLGVCLDKELVSMFSSVGFLILSLLIIIYKSNKLRSQNKLT